MVEYVAEKTVVEKQGARTLSWGRILLYVAAILVISGALVAAGYFFVSVREFVGQTTLPILPAVEPSTNVGIPTQDDGQDLPDIVQGVGRINFLLLGIDQRDDEIGQPTRTDTMILVSLDLESESITMLSIPRDLWVSIPGFGENRINVAHYLGDYYDYPGGGPALAMKTVSQSFGVPIHHFVRVDFDGFEALIDAVGGIDIDVPNAIHDETYPDDNYGTIVLDIAAGPQHMDGETALQYARTRHSTSDFDRMDRQQAVLMAARDAALGGGLSLTRIPGILEAIGESVQTDLTLQEILALADMASSLDLGALERATIDASMTTTTVTPSGAMVEVPDWDAVRALVDTLFPTEIASDSLATDVERAAVVAEEARIEIRNGTLVEGLAEQVTTHLREAGYNVVHYENADRFDFAETLIVSRGTTPNTVLAVARDLDIPSQNVLAESILTYETDILIILGRDLLSDF